MQSNLFVKPRSEPTEQDALALIACNLVAKHMRHRTLFYALKNAILDAFGTFDGYDAQQWDDPNWYMTDEGDDPVYATHIHILKRYQFMGLVFHRPTNEWKYWQTWWWGQSKKSENFDELRSQVKNEIMGKKAFKSDPESLERGWKALKFLVKQYGHLLRCEDISLTLPSPAGRGDEEAG